MVKFMFKFFCVFFQLFLLPQEPGPSYSWRGFCTLFYSIQYYTAYYPFLWVSVVRTRSGPGCLWHTSPTGNRTHNLGVLSIGFASTGTRFNRLRDFRMVYPMISGPTFCTSSTVKPGFVRIFVPSGIRTLAPPDLNCKWLKGRGTTVRKSSRRPTWSRPKCGR